MIGLLLSIPIFMGTSLDGARSVTIAVMNGNQFYMRLRGFPDGCLGNDEWRLGYYGLNPVSGHLPTWFPGVAGWYMSASVDLYGSMDIDVEWFTCFPAWTLDGLVLRYMGDV